MITVAQRLNTETDRKGKKSGRPMNYFGYSDLDPLEFPEYSARKSQQQFIVKLSDVENSNGDINIITTYSAAN